MTPWSKRAVRQTSDFMLRLFAAVCTLHRGRPLTSFEQLFSFRAAHWQFLVVVWRASMKLRWRRSTRSCKRVAQKTRLPARRSRPIWHLAAKQDEHLLPAAVEVAAMQSLGAVAEVKCSDEVVSA